MKDTELKRARDRALFRAYKKGLANNSFSNMQEAAEYARKQESPEFFICARTASLLIGRIMSHNSLADLNSYSRRRVWELYARYVEYLQAHPDCTMTRERILEELVEEPAPEFYIGGVLAKKIIYRELNKAREKW